ncbi:MAG: efflux RND transporter periplasmic adaptor subunit, partial [Candidatus Latescibacteria bacterium]|nr:efflux RND transporter periplasmic adaptor subunit [Candidatus Latescibacterota bacterium]
MMIGLLKQITSWRYGWKRKVLFALISVVVLIGAVKGFQTAFQEKAPLVASFPVKKGEFVISLTLKTGEIEAIKSNKVSAPMVRGEAKIVYLWPEGEKVDVGNLIIQFDQTEFKKRVADAEQAVDVAKAELEKTLANQKVEIARLESDIIDKEASLRIEQLNLQKMEYESEVTKEETRLKVKRAELAHAQAKKKFETQKIVNTAERTKLDLDIAQKERELEKAKRDFESLSIHAEKPGIVVYEKVWKGSRMEKVRVGDTPWGGQTLVDLPDLSTMQVKTFVNEVDVDKLKVDQKTIIKLDALPEPTFHGSITSIATLGRQKEDEKNVKVFDVVIKINEEDSRLKPGMSASSQVVMETIPDQVYVPLESVFEKNGKTTVYLMNGSRPEERVIKVGKKNDNYVIVADGVRPGDLVTLRDPTLTLQELGGTPEEEKEK